MSTDFRLNGRTYNAIIFDCDGVLLNSNDLKTSAFVRSAESAGFENCSLIEFSRWQRANFGISRFRVFESLLAGTFGAVPPQASMRSLLESFATIVKKDYLQAPEARDLRECLALLAGQTLFVASGSLESELREVFQIRDLDRYFANIAGSPTPKSEIVRNILSENRSIVPIMIGDSHADADAALANSIDFAFVSSMSNVRESMVERALSEQFSVFEDVKHAVSSFDLTPRY